MESSMQVDGKKNDEVVADTGELIDLEDGELSEDGNEISTQDDAATLDGSETKMTSFI